MRKQIAAANWKMNLTYENAQKLIDEIKEAKIGLSESQSALFAVPFPYLQMAKDKLERLAHYYAAAQNCYSKVSGPYTGEVSAEMLGSIQIRYCVIGHSER